MRANPISLVDGIVVDTSDPQQMGRLKVWCPGLDGPGYTVDNLPWVSYSSPLAGQINDYPAGSSGKKTAGPHSYGFWAVPKIGAWVVVGLLYGDTNNRVYIASMFNDHGNRSLPVGRNRPDKAKAPVSDTFDPVEPQTSNLSTQFGNLGSSQAKSRGVYERQVAQDKDNKDGTEGYQKGLIEPSLDPQTYCLATPGRHVILFQDNPVNSRLRIKSADGHQVIFDDVNERIYISTSIGNTWIELDKDGHVHLYGAASVSVGAGGDINLSAKGNISLDAGKNLNLGAGGNVLVSACSSVAISGMKINISSDTTFDILAAAMLTLTGSVINLNGPPASAGECADTPEIVPDHEPWDRPATKGKRGPNWRA